MGRIGILIPLALLALTGCVNSSSNESHTAVDKTPVPVRSSDSPSATADDHAPPQLTDAQKTFIKAVGKTGSRKFPAIPRIQRGTLEIGIICSGSGTVDVNVGSIVGYTVTCGNSDPGQFNEVGLKKIHDNVVVSVANKTDGSWGLAVGWTKHIDPPN
ncbi:hypothetical protein [Streptomyces sp. SLBN-31]|uniref:hypothetical protein n=1 Tax=Streptomyces sp. SLBN-31 TaxID=2768444 RepID=UPI001153CDB4|nr:hypothetical protein [Streptomyces sp. SLBN-31]TQJ75358.1 hypothetical protein FBY22_8398 [Streptomyces sp. SLBN-31]